MPAARRREKVCIFLRPPTSTGKNQMMSIERIWEDIHDELYAFVRSRLPDEAAAKDVTQDVFLTLQTKLPQLRNRDKVGSWLFQIARHAVADHYRREQRKGGVGLPESIEAPTLATDDRTEEFARCIPAMLELLPPIYREALRLTEIEGLSQKELAERLGIPYPTAKSRVQRGKDQLKTILLQCCRISTDVYGNVLDYEKRD